MTTPTVDERIAAFLAADTFAVVGASDDMSKYGAKIFAAYRSRGLEVYPVNPRAETIQGVPAYPNLAELPKPVAAISVITPPAVTEQIVPEAVATGVQHIWLQPGAESERAIADAEAAGLSVIAGGPCILVAFSLGTP